MLKERAREIGLLVAAMDVALLAAAFATACLLRFWLVAPFADPAAADFRLRQYTWLLGVSIPLLIYMFVQARLYDSFRRKRYCEIVWMTGRPFLISFALMGLAIFLVQDKAFSRAVFFAYFSIAFLLVTAEKLVLKLLARRARSHGYNSRNVVIVGTGPDALSIAALYADTPEYGYKVLGHVAGFDERMLRATTHPVLCDVGDMVRLLDTQAIDEVVFAVPYRTLPLYQGIIHRCEEVGITIHLKIDPVGALLSRTYTSQLGDFPMLTLASTPQDVTGVLTKRIIDVVGSAAAMLLLSPVMIMAWLAISLTSPGAAIFRQRRSGLNGRYFSMYKFRSMYKDAESRLLALRARNEMSGPVFKMTRDPRVTPVGRFLRRWSIDELPQLFNVLKGDMSLVGPRPP
ncbi:MAG: sugar transferase, partial [Acidobacteriota bacterium]